MVAVVFAVAACATVPVANDANLPYFSPNHLLALPKPGDLGRSLEMSQMITVRHDSDVFAFEGHISVTPERFYLVGVDGMGRRAMSVAWDRSGKITAERADWLPAAVRPGPMLADIILIYWPASVLQPALENAGAVLVDGPTSRSISIDGKEILKIDYLASGPQATIGRLHYRNSAWGYEIDVQSVEAAP